MAAYDSTLPSVFGALSDPTRLAVVSRLADGPASVTTLSQPHGISRQSFLKHLAVLERAGVVMSSKKGRVRTVALRPDTLDDVENFIRAHKARIGAQLDRLGDFLSMEGDDARE